MGSSPASALTYWERIAASRWGAYITEREARVLDNALDALSPGLAVEVGCEGGRWSQRIEKRGWSLICTDVDAPSVALCQERLPEATCLLVSPDDETLPVDTGRARLLLIYEVYKVIESRWILREAARVLEPGGMLVCSVWNPMSARGAVYRLITQLKRLTSTGRRSVHDYYCGPSYRAFRNDLRAHGFGVVEEIGLCWFPFRRNSDSRFVGPATAVEAVLGLPRVPTLSPWVLTVAVRENR